MLYCTLGHYSLSLLLDISVAILLAFYQADRKFLVLQNIFLCLGFSFGFEEPRTEVVVDQGGEQGEGGECGHRYRDHCSKITCDNIISKLSKLFVM